MQSRWQIDVCPLAILFLASLSFSMPVSNSSLSQAAIHVRRAQQLEHEKKWVEAEKEFRIARQEDPNSTAAAVGHAEALVQIGQPFDAELELEMFLKEHPDAERAHEFYAVVALGASDDFMVAQTELETCVKLNPANPLAWKSLGDVYLGRANAAQAIAAYARASHLRPGDPVIMASLADAYSENSQNDKAGAIFLSAIRMAAKIPDSEQGREKRAAVQYLYGKYLLDQNRAKDSVAAMTIAISYNPRSAAALYSRARAYVAMQDYKNAEEDALAAFQLDPHDKQGPLLLIDIYRKEHDQAKMEQYVEITQKIVDDEQQHSVLVHELLSLLGNAERALKKGQFQEAIPPYEELLKKLPTFYEAYFGLGMSYAETGRLADAEAALRKYVSFKNVSGDGHSALGIVLLQEGQGQKAIPELEQALQIDPSLDEARKALAVEYVSESKLDAAVRTLRGAQGSKDPQLIAMLGSVLLQKGDAVGARRELNRALALQPDDPDALKLKQEISSTSQGK